MKLPPYQPFPSLTGEGIVLRAVGAPDIPQLVDISFYDGEQAHSAEEAAALQEKINQDYADGHTIHWGIEDRASGKLVGTCGYYRGFAGGIGELGCVLLAPFRGRGYMTKAMKVAMAFGLEEMGLTGIKAITTRQNTKAVQLLRRLGFVKTAEHGDEVAYEFRPGAPPP
jgi:ribosomal-protein-alanine N-acetyltransferase